MHSDVPRRASLFLAATALSLAATGCGSTVQMTSQQGLADGQGLSQTDGSGLADGRADGVADGQQQLNSATGSVDGATGGSQGSALGGGAGSPTSGTGVPSRQQGASRSRGPLEVGILLTNTSGFADAGISIGQTVPEKEIYQALIDATNAAGGIDGRRVVPVWSTVGGSNWSTEFQAACANFTDDHKVSVVLGYAFIFMDSFESCLAKAGVPHLFGGYGPGDRAAQKQFPNVFSTTHPTVDLQLLTVLEGAITNRVVTKTTKLGIIFDDCNHRLRAFDATAVPYLRAQGIQYELYVLDCMGGGGDAGRSVQQTQSAQLKFRGDGITTVFVEDVAALLFMQNAEAQGWHPKYIMASKGAALEGNAPNNQLANVYGFGWAPYVDVNPRQQPPALPAQQQCVAKLKARDISPAGYNDFGAAYTMCDALSMYALGLQATKGRTGAAEVVAALERRAAGFTTASTYGGKVRSTTAQRGGAAIWRAWGWNTGCSCFGYTGSTRPLPQ